MNLARRIPVPIMLTAVGREMESHKNTMAGGLGGSLSRVGLQPCGQGPGGCGADAPGRVPAHQAHG